MRQALSSVFQLPKFAKLLQTETRSLRNLPKNTEVAFVVT